MKNSKQRNLILNIINNSYSHPNAYEIYEEAKKTIPNISLGTVYRNLNQLVSNNMILKINGCDDVEHYDKVFDKHSHFICNVCNCIYDIHEEISDKKTINKHKIISYDFKYNGICYNCLKKEEL